MVYDCLAFQFKYFWIPPYVTTIRHARYFKDIQLYIFMLLYVDSGKNRILYIKNDFNTDNPIKNYITSEGTLIF